MCGIVGYVGPRQARPILLDGLARLEYRGYDSAGLATIAGGRLHLVRSVGKLESLRRRLDGDCLQGRLGLGHTRWATHGAPSEANAHPHADCRAELAVVHNGIIENHAALRAELAARGHAFRSQTDTEVLAHLIEEALARRGGPPAPETLAEAVRAALACVRGAYALAVVWKELPETLVAAKTASPLVIGFGDDETLLASDVPAFLSRTRRVVFLEDGELALLQPARRRFLTLDGRAAGKVEVSVPWDHALAQKGGYRHFMLKEIHEQPQAIENTLRGRLALPSAGVLERELGLGAAELAAFSEVRLVACGTAFHAGLVGGRLLERWARLPAAAEVASEFRYRGPLLGPRSLVVAVSQSGETADTLAAARLARDSGAKVLAVCNTVGSALTRAADLTLYTRCGPEIGVASTKAYLGQVTALTLLAVYLANARGTMPDPEAAAWLDDLARLPGLLREALALEPRVAEAAEALKGSEHFLYLGRGIHHPTALEGALKLKEISYIHAEGFAAGEMKHGPIALIGPGTPVLAAATESELLDKTLSNLEEAKARGARILALATRGERRLDGLAEWRWELPPLREPLSPALNAVPLQLLAYHAAALRGCDVDQPRNLAKSVTVE